VGSVDGATTRFVDAGLAPQTSHAYTVQAVDGAGNLSPMSSPPATAQTPAATQMACQGRSAPPTTYAHVVWIWMENHSYSSIIGSTSAPYLNALAAGCGLATNYSAITHPSLPNYAAAISGSTQGITDDGLPSAHPLAVASIYSQVAALGGTWRDYEESAPANCPSADSGLYVVHHDPAPYYTGIRTTCQTSDVPLGSPSAGALVADVDAGTLPTFAFVTPNLCDDMHGATGCPSDLIAAGDAWLSALVPRITGGPNYQAGDTVVMITFDEGSTDNHVATFVISPYTPPGARSATALSHYSLLKTTEQLLGIGALLGHAGDSATAGMRPDFGL
jgi:hypothetical protein